MIPIRPTEGCTSTGKALLTETQHKAYEARKGGKATEEGNWGKQKKSREKGNGGKGGCGSKEAREAS